MSRREFIQRYLRRLRSNDPTLTDVDLRGESASAEEITAIVRAVRANSAVVSLKLSHSVAGGVSGALSARLLRNGTLRHLELASCGLGPDEARALSRGLRRNRNLTSLILSENRVRDSGAKRLAGALRSNSALRELALVSNGIGAGGAAALADAVGSGGNRSLRRLDLGWNAIGAGGMGSLAAALGGGGSALSDLGVGSCGIGAVGATALADALLKNETVERLDLSGNGIGPEGGAALAAALCRHPAVRCLDVRQNDLGEEVTKALAALLLREGGVELNLRCNALGARGAAAIAGSVRANPSSTRPVLRYLAPIRKILLAGTREGLGDKERLFGYLTRVRLGPMDLEPGTSREAWRSLLGAVYSAGTRQILQEFHREEANLIPSAMWRVVARLGLDGFYEIVRSKPDLFRDMVGDFTLGTAETG